MGRHDDLLGEGPREAPLPETAEQRSKRLGMRAAGGGLVAGGVAAAKFGGLAKVAVWLFAWHALNVWRVAGWIALVAVAALVATFFVLRRRREV
jgi:hypothetical protein